ncbi:hypothetical protein EAG18_09070 [Pseudoalteromonas sp. J010]|uniref:hypothetical protein n=1 Tax=Pseudoalteromonas sp. J010 TaxID=998465 RepID=UPI000F6488F5|nr:hypothetical protein [Pseudoalteromonas sp. J010]RRS09044.1 hypothetical protein EAG18_09070 [Pseudoalteromonas sp. J010]
MSGKVLKQLFARLELIRKDIQNGELDSASSLESSLAEDLKEYISEKRTRSQAEVDELRIIAEEYGKIISEVAELQHSTRKELLERKQNNKKVLIYKQFR